MKINKLEPIITTTKKGKEIKRFDTQLQKSTDRFMSNINAGVTPSGTRYYRELLPDKSWGTTYLRKKDGTEIIVDTCSAPFGSRAVYEKRENKKIISDKYIEHYRVPQPKWNIVREDVKAGQMSVNFIQDNVYNVIMQLKDVSDSLKPPKKSLVSGIFALFK